MKLLLLTGEDAGDMCVTALCPAPREIDGYASGRMFGDKSMGDAIGDCLMFASALCLSSNLGEDGGKEGSGETVLAGVGRRAVRSLFLREATQSKTSSYCAPLDRSSIAHVFMTSGVGLLVPFIRISRWSSTDFDSDGYLPVPGAERRRKCEKPSSGLYICVCNSR